MSPAGAAAHLEPVSPRVRRLCTLLLLVAGDACGDLSGGSSAADIDRAPMLALTEEIRIGSVDDADVGFSDIERVAVDDEGLVYVLERADRAVRVYSADGKLVRTIGGPGQGPGEFQFRITGWLGVVGDTLWVSDWPDGRITFFRRDGTLIETVTHRPLPLSAPDGYGVTLLGVTFRRDGLFNSTPLITTPNGAGRPTDVTLQVPTVRFNRIGAVVDTIRVQPVTIARGARRIPLQGRELIVPFAPRDDPLWMDRLDADDVFVIDRTAGGSPMLPSFDVTLMAGRADTVWHRTFTHAPTPFTQEMVDQLVAPSVASHVNAVRRADPAADSAATATSAASALRSALELPLNAPPVSLARVGEDGVLWLRREDRGEPTFRWVLIGTDGAPVGQLDVPRTVTVLWSSGEAAWASALDELEVPWLVRYRLAPAAPER